MTGPTMTCDPDLDSAIAEFRYVAQRLRTLDQQMLTAAVDRYKHFAAIKHERAELWANLRGKAEKLQLVPEDHHLGARALLMVTEVAWILHARTRRKPTPAMIKAMVRDMGELAERERVEAEADKVETEFRMRTLAVRVSAAEAVTRYIELSAA
jgi:hypothetical protein